MSELASLLPLVGIALLFWLLLIRPAQRRQRETSRMQSAIAAGDEVMLTSGIFGTVRAIGGDRLDVEIAPGVVVGVVRGAIGSVVTRAELPDEPSDEEAGELSEPVDRSDSDATETTEER